MKNKSSRQEVIPPLEFQSLLLPFYSQALLKLGKLTPETEQPSQVNLELANRLIALLEMLKAKTQGNLDEREQELMDRSIIVLKSFYLEVTNNSFS